MAMRRLVLTSFVSEDLLYRLSLVFFIAWKAFR